MRTVIGWDASKKSDLFPQGEPIFALKGGMELKNANGDIPGTGLGVQRTMDTLTYMKKLITVPKYYEVNISDYIPVVIGEGSWADNILTHLTINSSGDFEDGIINQGIDNAQLSKVNAAISSITVPVITWAKTVNYNQIELEQALFANNWNIINSRHESRQMNWENGVQQWAFLGSKNRNDVYGLFTQPDVNISGVISEPLSTLDYADYATFIGAIYEAYRKNCARTAKPNRFVMPEDDFNGMGVPFNPAYPMNTRMSWLLQTFANLGLSDMKVLPSAYGMNDYNSEYLSSLNRYAMYNYEEESIRMDIPVNIRSTMPGTLNNFMFQDVAYAMLTGVRAYRQLEMLYFDTPAT
jgi:hypothetical protein